MTAPLPIWISAAETSADLHGSQLIKALQSCAPEIPLIGMGGPEMRGQNFTALIDSESISAMGFTEVLSLLPRIFRISRAIGRYLRSYTPQAVVLIDAPDFHFHIAKKAAHLDIPVVYYISPQLWAWRQGRVKFLQKYVHKLLCILPFEKEFFASHGLDVEFVGHPLLEQIDEALLEVLPPVNNVIGIMPGSRSKELTALLPVFAQAAKVVAGTRPKLHWKIFQAPNITEKHIHSLWPHELSCEIVPFSYRYEVMKTCQLILTASGTASLECALLQIPALVAYKLSPISYTIARIFVDVPHISMPNLILQKGVYPEFIQDKATGENLADQILDWLQNNHKLQSIRNDLQHMRSLLGQSHASTSSAQVILQTLNHPIVRPSSKELTSPNITQPSQGQ